MDIGCQSIWLKIIKDNLVRLYRALRLCESGEKDLIYISLSNNLPAG